MKVILNVKIKNHLPGTIIDVKDGYGAHLIKTNQAKVANLTNVNALNKENAEKSLQENLLIKEMQDLANKIKKEKLVFYVKTGEHDQVFGVITTKKISDELKTMGYNIDKKKIYLDHDISSLGFHNIQIELHKKVLFDLSIELRKGN